MARNIALASAIVLVVTGLCASNVTADIVLNGSFEIAGSGGIADSADWNEQAGSAATTVSERNTANARSGLAAHRFFTETQGDFMAITQSSLSTLSVGDEVSLEFWIDGSNVNNNLVAILILQDTASWQESVTTIAFTDNQFGTYDQNLSSSIFVPNSVSGPISYSVVVNYSQGSPAGVQSEVWIDDVSLNVVSVPEPNIATIWLAGMVALVGQRRRRK